MRAVVAQLGRWGRLLSGVALDALFPPHCRDCGRSIESEETGDPVLCPECRRAVVWIDVACGRCGMPVVAPAEGARDDGERACAECRGRRLFVDRIVAAGLHDGPLRHLVLLHKFRGDRGALLFLAETLARLWRERLEAEVPATPGNPGGGAADRPGMALVPIPGRIASRIVRGRDPLRELAEETSRRIGLPLRPVLRRARRTPRQVGLPRARRIRNQVGAFAIKPGVEAPSVAVLIDDVVTTCATVSDAARALRRAGARLVFAIAVARSPC